MTLWMTVFEEDFSGDELNLSLGIGWRVAIAESSTLQDCSFAIPFRTSPVFPIGDEFLSPDLESQTYYFYFLVFDPAFPVIARLMDRCSPEQRSGMLFSLGLPSVVVITTESDFLTRIEELAGEKPRGSEVWAVEHGRIIDIAVSMQSSVQFDHERTRLPHYGSVPLVSKSAVDEFVASLALSAPKLAAHTPEELNSFLDLVDQVSHLVSEMEYATNPSNTPRPDTLNQYTEEDFSNNSELADTIVTQNTNRIVQINAALSYLHTQALSGAIPILERRGLIRRHSLLGIGTAILALARTARSIERAFAEASLETNMEQYGRIAAPLPGLESPRYDPTTWSDHSVDGWGRSANPREPYYKIPHFSGRFGFRETEYTISAALHSLVAGAGAEWSLLTLTHEMVHGHVRNLLSVIFKREEADQSPEAFEEFIHKRFVSRLRGQAGKDDKFIDTLRYAILLYACTARVQGSLTAEPKPNQRSNAVDGEVSHVTIPSTPTALRALLNLEWRNINEILVHVLDLHYFYLSSVSKYLPSIWRSWSSLPQVKRDPRQYILRSLLVVASKIEGSPWDRFAASANRMTEILEPLSHGSDASAATIREIVRLVGSQEAARLYFFPFQASLILVDLTHRVLVSSKIRGAIHRSDPHFQRHVDPMGIEEWFDYGMEDGFIDDVVRSPTAYIADRLTKRLQIPGGTVSERDTAILFLACSSDIGRRRTSGSDG